MGCGWLRLSMLLIGCGSGGLGVELWLCCLLLVAVVVVDVVVVGVVLLSSVSLLPALVTAADGALQQAAVDDHGGTRL